MGPNLMTNPLGFLGRYWRSLGSGSSGWQVRRCLCFHRYSRRRPRYVPPLLPSCLDPDTFATSSESTILASISTLAHHGIIFVPLGYSTTFAQLANLSEVRGGSPWGAGTFSAADGSRQPSALELEIATLQGKLLWNTANKVAF